MSGQKTEQATPKRKREARRKGQVARSNDLTGWLSLLAASYVLPATVGRIADAATGQLHEMRRFAEQPDPRQAAEFLGAALTAGFVAMTPLLVVGVVMSVVATVGQTGLVFSPKALVPDFKRVSPAKGLKRLFSARSAWETGKQVIKIAVVGLIAMPQVIGLVERLSGRGRLPLGAGLAVSADVVMGVTRTIIWTVVILSLADYGYQRYQHRKDLMMSRQDVRDEYKSAEGDGAVKARIRSMQRSMARNRMISDMAHADVVITNPTHIAVALRYDATTSRAPVVVAVGAGSTAARIRQRADEASIPMVEAKPLARALWRSCDVGDEIPVALYEAVAKVLAFVRRLDRRYGSGQRYELPRSSVVSPDLLDAVARKRRRR